MKDLTEQEKELIAAIRNFRGTKHNPSQNLEVYAVRVFEQLMYED